MIFICLIFKKFSFKYKENFKLTKKKYFTKKKIQTYKQCVRNNLKIKIYK